MKLHKAVIREELGRPYEILLDVVAIAGAREAPRLLAKPLGVSLLTSTGVRHFHGLVSEQRFIGMRGELALYQLSLRPWLWFLGRTRNCRIFQDQSVIEILVEIFCDHGFGDFQLDHIRGDCLPREFVMQYRESDLDFVQRLMEDEGIYYFFRHEAERHVLVLCDDSSVHQPAAGFERVAYLPDSSDQVGIDSWQVCSRVEAARYTVKDFDFQMPRGELFAPGPNLVQHSLTQLEVFDYPGGFNAAEQGPLRARIGGEIIQAQSERCWGSTRARGVTCGSVFELTEHDVKAYNQKYLVVSSELTIAAPDLESGSQEGAEMVETRFSACPAHRQFRLPRSTPKPNMAGVQSAIVTGRAKEDIETDRYGRVRVKFHWDRAKKEAQHSSCWLRVAQSWAGSGFGTLYVPRVGQEVIVEFLDGDPDRPIIVGSVYNGSHQPPFLLPDNCAQSGVRSSTHLGKPRQYNEIRFDDRKGAEELSITAQRNKTELVKANRSARVGGNDALSVAGDRKLHVAGDLDIGVGEEGGNCSITPSQWFTVIATKGIALRCGSSALLIEDGKIQLVVGNSVQLTLDAQRIAASVGGGSASTPDQDKGSPATTLTLDKQICATTADASFTLNAVTLLEAVCVNVKGKTTVDVQGGQILLNSPQASSSP